MAVSARDIQRLLAADLTVMAQQKALVEGQLRSVQEELDALKTEKADASDRN